MTDAERDLLLRMAEALVKLMWASGATDRETYPLVCAIEKAALRSKRTISDGERCVKS